MLPGGWLFPGQNPVNPLTARQLSRIFHGAKDAAEIDKRVSLHTLRHCPHGELVEPCHPPPGAEGRYPRDPGAAGTQEVGDRAKRRATPPTTARSTVPRSGRSRAPWSCSSTPSRNPKHADPCGRPQHRFTQSHPRPANRPTRPANLTAKSAPSHPVHVRTGQILTVQQTPQPATASRPPSNPHRTGSLHRRA